MTSNYTPPVPTLTVADVQALRAAVKDGVYEHRYVVQVRYDRPADTEPVATVTLLKEIDMGEHTDPRFVWQRHDIVAHGGVQNYAGREYRSLYASDRHYAAEIDSALRTVASLAKPGDWLRVLFRLGNDTDALRAAGLTTDECIVAVMRGNKCVGHVVVQHITAPVGSASLMGGLR